MDMNQNEMGQSTYTVKNFLPLIIIFSFIGAFTLLMQIVYGFNINTAMYDFMGAFFVVFGLFKIINLSGFAQAYTMYDIIAKRSKIYAHLYPFIELALGVMYLTRYQLLLANWITLILMIIGSIGIALELAKGKTIVCACLGVVFKIPMTYVTLAEDIIMGLMALIMLVQYYIA
ncbi:hypothetical protein BH09DEP1_BH09DEP1_0740 [soil metagenome]